MASRADTAVVGSAAALSALALFFATGLHPIPALVWIAPIPVLLAAHAGGARRAALLAFAAWFAGGLNVWAFLHVTLSMPAPVVFVLTAVPAVAFALAVLLSRALLRRRALVSATLAVPSLWVAFEYLLSRASPHGTYGSLAYTQMDALAVLQLASVTGVWGIGFLLMLIPSALAVAFHARREPRAAGRLLAGVAALGVSTLAFGAYRLHVGPAGAVVPVALFAVDGPASRLPEGDEGLRLVEEYAQAVANLPLDGARLLVLPEKIARLDGARAAQARQALAMAAAHARVTIVAGLQETDPTPRVLAFVFAADGAPPQVYAKQHLLPPFESENEPGRQTLVIEGTPRWGVEICKDMDFPALSREYAASGVGLLAVPAWDFVADGWLHGRMAVMRGVEGGFAIARTARSGRLTVSDARGRVVAETASRAEPTLLTAAVETGTGLTAYARFGDWFAWLNLAALVVGLARLARARLRTVSPASDRLLDKEDSARGRARVAD